LPSYIRRFQTVTHKVDNAKMSASDELGKQEGGQSLGTLNLEPAGAELPSETKFTSNISGSTGITRRDYKELMGKMRSTQQLRQLHYLGIGIDIAIMVTLPFGF